MVSQCVLITSSQTVRQRKYLKTKAKWHKVKMAKNTFQTILIARNKKHTTTYTNIHITTYRQADVEHGTKFSCANPEPTWSDMRSFRKYSSIFNMKYNASLGTNTNIHIRTVQMVALFSLYYVESNTLSLQCILYFTGKYINIMFRKLMQGYMV